MDRKVDNDMAVDNDMDSRHEDTDMKKVEDRQHDPWAYHGVHKMQVEMVIGVKMENMAMTGGLDADKDCKQNSTNK